MHIKSPQAMKRVGEKNFNSIMKTIAEFKRGECFWKHGMLYKVITKFDGQQLRAKCIADGEVERFEDEHEAFSTKAL